MALLAAVALAVTALPLTHAQAQGLREFVIGYLQLARDARYTGKRTYARFLTGSLGRPYSGAKTAIREIKFVGSALGLAFKLEREKLEDATEAVSTIRTMSANGVRYFVTDLPADVLATVARKTRDLPILLLNASAGADRLRGKDCQAHLLHVIPSHAMLNDALAQYLVFKKWRRVLMLEGPAKPDRALAESFAGSAKRLGLDIIERRPFVVSNDPRDRDRNNVALLTAGVAYDVIFVADTDGEFARDVPFQSVLPRPVVGSEGLAAAAWHWAWERHGAPQLERRFYETAKRPMRDVDWAAWIAVKAVVEAVVRSEGGDFEKVRAFLLGDEIILDGFKGNRMNFRPWNGQLRQPILLITHNWVVERTPLAGFLHPTNNLDTLGIDEHGNACKR